MNGLVSLPETFWDENLLLSKESFDVAWCPSCKLRTFHEMCGPMPLMHKPAPTKWYWCSNCHLQVRRSELNGVIDKYLGETKIVKIDMTARASMLPIWLKRLQGWFWN